MSSSASFAKRLAANKEKMDNIVAINELIPDAFKMLKASEVWPNDCNQSPVNDASLSEEFVDSLLEFAMQCSGVASHNINRTLSKHVHRRLNSSGATDSGPYLTPQDVSNAQAELTKGTSPIPQTPSKGLSGLKNTVTEQFMGSAATPPAKDEATIKPVTISPQDGPGSIPSGPPQTTIPAHVAKPAPPAFRSALVQASSTSDSLLQHPSTDNGSCSNGKTKATLCEDPGVGGSCEIKTIGADGDRADSVISDSSANPFYDGCSTPDRQGELFRCIQTLQDALNEHIRDELNAGRPNPSPKDVRPKAKRRTPAEPPVVQSVTLNWHCPGKQALQVSRDVQDGLDTGHQQILSALQNFLAAINSYNLRAYQDGEASEVNTGLLFDTPGITARPAKKVLSSIQQPASQVPQGSTAAKNQTVLVETQPTVYNSESVQHSSEAYRPAEPTSSKGLHCHAAPEPQEEAGSTQDEAVPHYHSETDRINTPNNSSATQRRELSHVDRALAGTEGISDPSSGPENSGGEPASMSTAAVISANIGNTSAILQPRASLLVVDTTSTIQIQAPAAAISSTTASSSSRDAAIELQRTAVRTWLRDHDLSSAIKTLSLQDAPTTSPGQKRAQVVES